MEEFYTLKGYQRKEEIRLTEAMEDYLEMIYRKTEGKNPIRVKDLATLLHVKPSSVSRMVNKLKKENLLDFPKYGEITLTSKGKKTGKYLLFRHKLLVEFFQYLNCEDYQLEQVEKVEHFLDQVTIRHLESFLKNDFINANKKSSRDPTV